ncbi:MAG: hypothetical protein ABIE68_03620 [bacterium]
MPTGGQKENTLTYVIIAAIATLLIVVGVITYILWKQEQDSYKAPEMEDISTEDTETNTDADTEANQKTSDSDGDRLTDWEENNTYQTSPYLKDTDGDGFDDKTEIDGGFDPLTPAEGTESSKETTETDETFADKTSDATDENTTGETEAETIISPTENSDKTNSPLLDSTNKE